MKITVWSSLSGKLSGHLVLNVNQKQPLQKVIDAYCKHKGVLSSKRYIMRSKANLLLSPNKSLDQLEIKDGDTLTVGLLDDEEQTFAFGSWWVVTLAAFIIGGAGLGLTLWTFMEPTAVPLKYGIVMDAGSSHSEMFVFVWNGDKPLGTADVSTDHRCFMAGGIDSFVTKTSNLSTYLEKCIDEVKLRIPTDHHAKTILYVGATAGMRILRDFDHKGSELVISSLREALEVGTPFVIRQRNVGIIEGTVEGASGWIAVNYLMDNLKEADTPTAASLDVGGASMQVTTVVEESETWSLDNLTLFEQNYLIVSESFLCYGVGEAQHRYNYFTVTRGNSSNIIDPCVPKGAILNITTEELNGPCTHTGDKTPVLSKVVKWHKLKKLHKYYKPSESEIKESSGDTDELYSISVGGSSNPPKCYDRMKDLFNLNLCNETFTYGDCMNSNKVPTLRGDFVAFSGLFHNMMLILNVKPNSSLADFYKIVYEVCSLNAEQLYKKYPVLPQVLANDLCFDSMYVYTLLTDGLGIGSKEFSNIQFKDKVSDNDIEWPLGFMVNRTTDLPAVFPKKSMDIAVFTLLLCLFGAFLISALLFCRHSIKIKNKSSSYQRSDLHQA